MGVAVSITCGLQPRAHRVRSHVTRGSGSEAGACCRLHVPPLSLSLSIVRASSAVASCASSVALNSADRRSCSALSPSASCASLRYSAECPFSAARPCCAACSPRCAAASSCASSPPSPPPPVLVLVLVPVPPVALAAASLVMASRCWSCAVASCSLVALTTPCSSATWLGLRLGLAGRQACTQRQSQQSQPGGGHQGVC